MKKFNLLHMVSIEGRGGTGATASRIVKKLAERGHNITFLALPGSLSEEVAKDTAAKLVTDIEFRRGFRPFPFFRDVRRVRKIIREENIQIIHVHRSVEYWTAVAAIILSGRTVKLVRNRGIVVPIRGHCFNRLLHNRFTALVIATATRIEALYKSVKGFDRKKIVTLLDGVDVSAFHPDIDGQRVRREFGVGPDTFLIGIIARLSWIKGQEFLLEAVARLRERHPTVKVLLAGKGRRREFLEGVIRQHGLEDAVIFTGFRKDIPDVLAAVDLFALPSVGSEGSSRGTLEAMAAGKAVVASDVGVIPDVVVDLAANPEEGTGFIVPPKDTTALAKKLEVFLNDRALLTAAGARGRARAEALFDESLMVEKLEGLYETILGGGTV